ncbi:hypothetical protein M501DRAFT_1002315 [Patellaria atrata CBS 101060]|uniref:BZIP domain-containing protein n=1 Tax=Patellaria atrata CBS 101060 TaxID=1346257 RepID=A0A9P4SE04_9PEZI|nr:hypothetical protein M501DRAFT_1002315 [Patellaria atrata CBS 101060]
MSQGSSKETRTPSFPVEPSADEFGAFGIEWQSEDYKKQRNRLAQRKHRKRKRESQAAASSKSTTDLRSAALQSSAVPLPRGRSEHHIPEPRRAQLVTFPP